jgi:hypothetical protein
MAKENKQKTPSKHSGKKHSTEKREGTLIRKRDQSTASTGPRRSPKKNNDKKGEHE